MTEKRTPVAERQRETATRIASPPAGGAWITGRIPGRGARAWKRA